MTKTILWQQKSVFLLITTSFLLCTGAAQCQPAVKPSAEQVKWANAEIGVIIHLDINIYAPETFDYKDSNTLPDVNTFNPSRLNTDQWIKTAKAAGAKYAVLTVKHGTGFCLWPSKVNPYNVGHTRWRNGKADILRSFILSCKKYGLKPGLYYNTNSNTYYNAGYKPFASDSAHFAYNKAVLVQLTELWGNYGKIFEIWFDGGINNDERFGIEKPVLKLIHDKQPQAILFQGPVTVKNIIRWIGNEDGIAAYPQWSRTDVTTASDGVKKIDDLHGKADGKIWCPGESDFPIRRNNAWNGGWLWKAGEDHQLFTVQELTDKYHKSVGRNTNMLIGMVVDTSGLIPKADSLVFDSLGKTISNLFAKPVFSAKDLHKKTVELSTPVPQKINCAVIEENLTVGENIRSYHIEAWINHRWVKIAEGLSVGHKRIQNFSPIVTKRIRFNTDKSIGLPSIKRLEFYRQ